MKILYDASIHLGQFSLDEETRIRCKNSQASIKNKGSLDGVMGVTTFCENTETDHLIWERLTRHQQDVFYPWMDVYHTIKDIQKVRDTDPEVRAMSYELGKQYSLPGYASSILAAGIISSCNEIHTLYDVLLSSELIKEIEKNYNLKVMKPLLTQEIKYSGTQKNNETGKEFTLEVLYQEAMAVYRIQKLDVYSELLKLQKDEGRK